MTGEVLPVSRRIVEAFFLAQPGRAAEVPAEVFDMGRRRLEMGVPLEPMLHVYRVAAREVWDAIVAATPSGGEGVLAELGAAWMDYMDRASSVAASSYLDASHERLRRLDARRGALLEALLAISDPTDAAALSAEYATQIGDAYVPVLVAAPQVAARIDGLAAAAPRGTVGGFRGAHVLLLLPADAVGDGFDFAAFGRDADATVVHGHAAPPGPALAAELGHTERLLTVALAASQSLAGPDDLVLEQLVAASPRLAGVLRRRVVDPLAAADRTGVLRSSLQAYLATGSVPATARVEVVHNNTVTYRLGRVATVTGLDPRVPAEAALLALALVDSTNENRPDSAHWARNDVHRWRT
jgi:hypothetical protein